MHNHLTKPARASQTFMKVFHCAKSLKVSLWSEFHINNRAIESYCILDLVHCNGNGDNVPRAIFFQIHNMQLKCST
jgi:hypothetical protein